jgi:hypothetical protein
MARPSKMTPETVERILNALRAGNTRRAAAGYGYVDEGTFERWMRRYAGFAGEVHLAEHEAEVAVVSNLLSQVQSGDVRACIFWLERRRPDTWGRRDHVDTTGGFTVTYTNHWRVPKDDASDVDGGQCNGTAHLGL